MRRQPNSHHCIVCGLRNEAGLKARFFDTVGEVGRPEVLARFTGGSIHQGYPGRMHGGVASGLLDEVIGRAVNAAAGDGDPTVWGVAIELSARFERPVPLEVELTARGRLTRDRRRVFEGTGEIYLPDGTVAVRAEGRYVKLPLEKISEVDPEELGWRVYED
jgi:acyl-coenzyme A thioesterase PaaI-like protein